jgi:hypothetical protein
MRLWIRRIGRLAPAGGDDGQDPRLRRAGRGRKSDVDVIAQKKSNKIKAVIRKTPAREHRGLKATLRCKSASVNDWGSHRFARGP